MCYLSLELIHFNKSVGHWKYIKNWMFEKELWKHFDYGYWSELSFFRVFGPIIDLTLWPHTNRCRVDDPINWVGHCDWLYSRAHQIEGFNGHREIKIHQQSKSISVFFFLWIIGLLPIGKGQCSDRESI